MTNILFLSNAADRVHAAAAWIIAARRERKSVLIYAPEPDTAERLNHLLWSQPATGFLPHCRAESPLAAETPVLFATDLDHPQQDSCLLNLSNEIPPGFSRFTELVEIVSTDDNDRLPARERFRFYRERGYALNTQNAANGDRG